MPLEPVEHASIDVGLVIKPRDPVPLVVVDHQFGFHAGGLQAAMEHLPHRQGTTAIPIGMSKDDLPISIQVLGPYLEDRTTIEFARLVGEEIGGYQRPPGYD